MRLTYIGSAVASDGGPPPTITRSKRTRARLRGVVVLAAAMGLVGPGALTAQAASHAPQAGGGHVAGWPGNKANPYGGTDYYLDAAHGHDRALGTSPARAWQSLAKASATTFAPGDRVLLKAGEQWNDAQLWPKGSGTVGRPIVIDAYGDPDVPHIRRVISR